MAEFLVIKIIVACFLYFFLKYLWSRRFLYYYGSKVKGPFAFPIIGSSYKFWGGILEGCLQLSEQYGQLFKLWIGPRLYFVIRNHEDVKFVLNTVLDKEQTIKFLEPVFGNGLILLSAAEWKFHKKAMNGAFNQRKIKTFVETFEKYANILVSKLNEKCIDLFPIMSECTLDIVSDTMMGATLNDMQNSDHNLILWTSRLAEISFMRITNPLIHSEWSWNLTFLSRESRSLYNKVSELILQTIKNARSKKSKNSNYQKDTLLDCFFKLEEEGVWTENLSVAECRTVLVAGGDTTAVTMGFVLMMLGMHKKIQTKVLQEIDCVFDGCDRNVTVEDLHKLTYLERVIKETLRIFPLGPVISRHITKDLVLGIHTLPKGSSVMIPIICIHRDPEVWPQPLKFDPDRFLAEEVAKRHPYSYLPFSAGPRACIGFRYAMMAMKTVLSVVLRHYQVDSTEYKCVSEVKLKMDVATKCVNGQKVQLRKR